MSACGGPREVEPAVPQAVESQDVGDITMPCTEDKIMYIYPQEFGLTQVRDESGGPNQSLPQFLKVLVDGSKSCSGSRYYFSILEGPYVRPATHWDVRSSNNEWSVTKEFQGSSTLIEENPHLGPFAIVATYTGMSLRNDNSDGTPDGIRIAGTETGERYAVASVTGDMEFNGTTTQIAMELDIITPNTTFNVAIPDTIHSGAIKYQSNVPKAAVWLRVDAITSPVAWSAGAVGNDRYLHFGTGSAGCFTNLDATRSSFNSIFDDITRSRVSVNGIYAGTIRFNMPAARYAQIETQLRAYAAANSLPYVWDNQIVNP